MKRKLHIFQYGSQIDPIEPTRYSPSDWIEISVSESSPSERSCSIGGPPVPNSSDSEASVELREELTYDSTTLDLNMTEMSPEFRDVCTFFKQQIENIGGNLPSTWTLEGFTQLVLGEEEVFDAPYLASVYSNLRECGVYSGFWDQALGAFQLINGTNTLFFS